MTKFAKILPFIVITGTFVLVVLYHKTENKERQSHGSNLTDGTRTYDYDSTTGGLLVRHMFGLNKETDEDHTFGCGNIAEIELISKLGNGISKQGFLGMWKGIKVVVKMPTLDLKEVEICLNSSKKTSIADYLRQYCMVYPKIKMLREVLLLQQLRHPNIVRMLGYCIRGDNMTSLKMDTHGLITVAEYGIVAKQSEMSGLPWRERLRHAYDIAVLMQYLENSPIGSIKYRDYKLSHFVMINESLKLFDLDMIVTDEPRCSKNKKCEHNVTCDLALSQCVGSNAKFNMYGFWDHVTSRILKSSSVPNLIQEDVSNINDRLRYYQITPNELVSSLMKVRMKTKSLETEVKE